MSDAETPETLQIRSQIERTRAEMSGTINAIQEKLNPQHIAEQVRHTVHEQFEEAKATVRDATIGKAEAFMRDAGDSVNDVRYTTMDTVRSNPIPAAMVAIGLGWLFMNRSSSRQSRERHEQYIRHRSDQYGYSDQYRYNNQYRGEMTYNPNHPAYRGDAMAMYPRGVYPSSQHQDEGMLAQGQRRVGNVVSQAQSAVGDTAHRAQSAVGGAVGQAQSAVGQAASTVGGAVGQAASTVGGAVGQATSTVGGAVSQAQSAVGDAAQQAAQVASQTVNRAQETAGQIAHRTAYAAGRVEDQFQRTMWENPLAVGAVALAVGVAAGFALPQTERENQLMGEARDNLMEQAQQVASETVDKVQRVAGEVAKDAQQTATDKAREVGLTGNTK